MARERMVGYALLAPALFLVGGLLVYPLFYDLWLSVTDAASPYGLGGFAGLRHYRQLVGDPTFWEAARNTLILVVVTASVELVVGIVTALFLWWRFWGRAFVFLSVFVPWAFPATFSAFAWYWLLTPPFHTFYTLELQAARWYLEAVFGMGAWQVLSIAIMNVWRGSSIIAVFLLAGFNAIPEELLDVGRLEAPSAWRYFWRVVAPLSQRFLALAALVAVVITYIEYASMYVETGGRIILPVLGTLAYREAIQNGNSGLGAALALIPIPFAIALVWGCLRFVEDRRPRQRISELTDLVPVETRHHPSDPPPDLAPAFGGSPLVPAVAAPPALAAPGRRPRFYRVARFTAGVSAALLVTGFHLFPLYYTAVQAFRPVSEYALGNPFWAHAPTFDEVAEVIRNPTIWLWGWNTLVVFGAVLGLGLTASLLAGYALARFELPGGQWLARLMFFSYFIPPIAVIVPIFQLFVRWGLDDSIRGIVLLYLTLAIPFATWLFFTYFQGLSGDVEECALLDGSRAQVFARIVLPMSWPVVIAAGLFAVGMMGSDVLYGSVLSLGDGTKTLTAGLGMTAVQLDEWASANAAILLSASPLVVLCAALSPYYVRGLRAALIEGA